MLKKFYFLAKWFSYTYTLFSAFFSSMVGLALNTEYSSLCYTVGSCCLSILYIKVHMEQLVNRNRILPFSCLVIDYNLHCFLLSYTYIVPKEKKKKTALIQAEDMGWFFLKMWLSLIDKLNTDAVISNFSVTLANHYWHVKSMKENTTFLIILYLAKENTFIKLV